MNWMHLYEDLQAIIEQHHRVNRQHEELGTVAGRIRDSVRDMAGVSRQSKRAADQLAQSGAALGQASDTAEKSAEEGKTALAVLADSIRRIEAEAEAAAQNMERLTQRSKEIGKIIEVINGITSQTQLLALNAAIEAARAGDAGRGFAVVAGEVRKLAELTEQSTKGIVEVIRAIQQETAAAAVSAQTSREQARFSMEQEEVVSGKIEEIASSFATVRTEVDQAGKLITEQQRYASDIEQDVNACDEWLATLYEQLKGHVEAASVVDEKLAASVAQVREQMKTV